MSPEWTVHCIIDEVLRIGISEVEGCPNPGNVRTENEPRHENAPPVLHARNCDEEIEIPILRHYSDAP